MSKPPVTVRLDPRRLEQLKAIAVAEHITVTEVITQIIRSKVADGVIAATIPGVAVSKINGGVMIDMGTGKAPTYANDTALAFAACMREVAGGGASVVSLDNGYAVVRQGVGIKLTAPFPGDEVTFPASLVEDIASLIEEAAK